VSGVDPQLAEALSQLDGEAYPVVLLELVGEVEGVALLPVRVVEDNQVVSEDRFPGDGVPDVGYFLRRGSAPGGAGRLWFSCWPS